MADAGTGAATTAGRGLEGIVVAESELSLVDGTNGRLYYRGYSIHDLVQSASFEEVLYLLWYGELPTRAELDELNAKLVAARALSPSVMEVLRVLPRGGEPIDALRAAVTVMGMEDDDAFNFSRDALLERSIRLTGAMATMLAAFDRLRHGKEPVEPDPSLGHAANFLYMLRGERASELQERAMDAYLVLLAEHSMNASTFSARVTLSALSDIYSAVSSALGTLKGDAHGGANRRAMEMLLAIGSADKAEAYVEESLRIKRRLMGLGHRIYKTRDPRVDHLMGLLREGGCGEGRHDLARSGGAPGADHEYPPVLPGAQAVPERGVLLGSAALRAAWGNRPHACGVRGQPDRWLDGEPAGAGGSQPDHPPAGGVRWA